MVLTKRPENTRRRVVYYDHRLVIGELGTRDVEVHGGNVHVENCNDPGECSCLI